MLNEVVKCAELVSGSGRWTRNRCSRWAKQGNLYCGTHDPDARREREDKRIREGIAANVARQQRIEATREHYIKQVVACDDETQAKLLVREIAAWGGGWR